MVVDNMDKVVYDTIDGNLLSKEEEVKILLPVEEPIDKSSKLETFPTEEDDEEPLIMDEEVVNQPSAALAPVIEIKEEVIIEKPETAKMDSKALVKEEQYIEPKKKESSKKPSKAVKKDSNFYKIQLASFKSKSDAEKEWLHLSKKLPKHIGAHEKYIAPKDVEGKGIFYRLQIGPFETIEEANKTCKFIKQSGVNCFTVKPTKI
jgi:cell division septation protein DedD